MASTSQVITKPPNWLDGDRVPAEVKLNILEHVTSHHDLFSLIEAYSEWTLPLWKAYPRQLTARAWDTVLNDIDPDLIPETIWVFHIRKIRKDYAAAMGSARETQQHRDRLQGDLRAILSMSDDPLPEAEASLYTIIDLAKVIRDVHSLTFRYSNDAWKRVHHIEEETRAVANSPPGRGTPPAIQLTRIERFRFVRAFLRVEIYLLTKYWTNAQGERHILDMGANILPFIPHSRDVAERSEFDSCLRYMFHAYRRHLKMTAKELGAPELPTRDDLPWVRAHNENYDYQYGDYPTFTTDNRILNFTQRSVSEEQCFLLWLCEFGIGPLEGTHQAEASKRRDELIRCFGERHTWETVELRHRFSRYDYCVDQRLSSLCSHNGLDTYALDRNRHPVMSLYGRGRHQRYANVSSKWACATAFLIWDVKRPDFEVIQTRDGITLNEHGRWITLSDTDSGSGSWNPFCLKDRVHDDVPHGHPYMFTHEEYEFRSQPKRVHLVVPR